MRKVAAFVTALLLFCASAAAAHLFAGRSLDVNSSAFGTWISSKKDMSYVAVASNLEEDTVLLFGSSEFGHGKKSPYHPRALFKEAGMNVMCIGAAGNQCLSHAITLGATGGGLQSGKVVLLLSPTWFTGGVEQSEFCARFSESMFEAMLQNENLPADLRAKIAARSMKLLAASPGMRDAAGRDIRVLTGGAAGLSDRLLYRLDGLKERERDRISVSVMWKLAGGRSRRTYERAQHPAVPGWDALAAQADAEFAARSSNEFHMEDSVYAAKIKPVMGSRKSAYRDMSWETSTEYDDLRLFLDVCAAQKLDVCLVLLPVNGYWYDYTGFQAADRRVLDDRIRTIADEYGVKLCDFFDEAYNVGFLEDATHPAGEGWVRINEKVYEFYHEGEEAV